MEVTLEMVQKMITEECDGLKALLLEKNKSYGNSAIEPRRIFSRSDPVEQIKVRIDDKLSRIATLGSSTNSEDTVSDLAGYLVLLKIAERIRKTRQKDIIAKFGAL
jgi:hypothetical protein